MPATPVRPPALVGRVFRGSAAIAAGHVTAHQLRSSAWRRLYPDVYACASLEVTHELLAGAVARVLVPGAVASGRTAALLWDVDLAGPDDDVEVTVAARTWAGAVAGVRLTRRRLSTGEVTTRRGVPTTTPLRTALDLSRIHPIEDAVVALDRFLAPGLVFLEEVRAAADALTGRDCRHVRRVARLADGLAGSPQETRLRLLLHRSGLPLPVAQHTVRDADGRRVARVDFAWPDHRLAVEYEGLWHGEHQQVARDRQRLNALTRAGWRVVFVTAADLRHPARLIARLAEELGAPRFA